MSATWPWVIRAGREGPKCEPHKRGGWGGLGIGWFVFEKCIQWVSCLLFLGTVSPLGQSLQGQQGPKTSKQQNTENERHGQHSSCWESSGQGGGGRLAGAEGPAPPPHSPLSAGEPQGSPSLPAPLSHPGLFLEALRSSDLLGWEWSEPPKDRAPCPRSGPSGLPASQFARGFWLL